MQCGYIVISFYCHLKVALHLVWVLCALTSHYSLVALWLCALFRLPRSWNGGSSRDSGHRGPDSGPAVGQTAPGSEPLHWPHWDGSSGHPCQQPDCPVCQRGKHTGQSLAGDLEKISLPNSCYYIQMILIVNFTCVLTLTDKYYGIICYGIMFCRVTRLL